MSDLDSERLRRLEARIDALSTTVKTTLTTLVIRGLLTQAAVKQILDDAEHAMAEAEKQAGGAAELSAIEHDLPAYRRAATGPPPDAEEHDD